MKFLFTKSFFPKLASALFITLCVPAILGAQIESSREYSPLNGSTAVNPSSGMDLIVNGNNIIQWTPMMNGIISQLGVRPGSRDLLINYTVSSYNSTSTSRFGIHGWTENPYVEYFIIENWSTWRPVVGEYMGTITSQGGTYDIYRTMRVNQPSVFGMVTYYQYWSVRVSKSTSATINLYDHFAAWANRGMRIGELYEVMFTIEAFQSSGYLVLGGLSMYSE